MLLGWWYLRLLVRGNRWARDARGTVDDLVTYVAIGVIASERLFTLFYQPALQQVHPLDACKAGEAAPLALDRPGHRAVAVRWHAVSLLRLCDYIGCAAFGLVLVRLASFRE